MPMVGARLPPQLRCGCPCCPPQRSHRLLRVLLCPCLSHQQPRRQRCPPLLRCRLSHPPCHHRQALAGFHRFLVQARIRSRRLILLRIVLAALVRRAVVHQGGPGLPSGAWQPSW
jgi:hypothetical protein